MVDPSESIETAVIPERGQLPDVGGFLEIRVLLSHDAKPVTGRGLHNAPGFYLANAFGAQTFKSRHFRLDIICLDIQMYAAGVVHPLHFDVQTQFPRIESAVSCFLLRAEPLDTVAQGLPPEPGGLVKVAAFAIYNKTCQTTFVHDRSPTPLQGPIIPGRLFVFVTCRINNLAIQANADRQRNRPTANLAILNVFLVGYCGADQHAEALSAVRAAYPFFRKRGHDGRRFAYRFFSALTVRLARARRKSTRFCIVAVSDSLIRRSISAFIAGAFVIFAR
jgi:hypothetical protein